MDNRKRRALAHAVALAVGLLWLALGSPLQAQETVYDEGDFYLSWNDGGPRFIQRLSWNQSDLALRSEVVLEEFNGGRYRELLKQSSDNQTLLVSLRPGRYRYQVRVYNLLNQNEYSTDWVSFEVLNAVQPRIDDLSPVELILDGAARLEITVTGRDIDAGADWRIRPIGAEGPGIRPRSITAEGDRFRLVFLSAELPMGLYAVSVRNPGGLEDSRGVNVHPPVIAAEAPDMSRQAGRIDFTISAAYAPLIPMYGVLFVPNVFSETFFHGAVLRFGMLPFRWGGKGPDAKGFGHYLGVELGVSWYMLEEKRSQYTVGAQVLDPNIRILYQLWLPGRTMAINVRAGAGATMVLDLYYDNGGDARHFTAEYISLEGGLSLQTRLSRYLFFEVGADFTHVLSPDDTDPPGYIRPVLGVLWQF
ncbi:hypothetical protein AGMMS49579_08550 [Spirochaetia bacterium]|nr:hypothetical protein AGMMS49579_08550 [Spirochaetia bacterium]